MQQPNAASKGYNQTLCYRFLTFQQTRTLYSQTRSDTKPVAPQLREKLERIVFQPRDRGEVFWNMALLSIEQTSSLLQHKYEYKGSDITLNNIGTATLRQPPLLYTSSITT